jgi:ABC-type antimicrobial peptide transport system permease subunit
VVLVLTWKLRITVLWIFVAVCQTAAMALLMFEPGVIRDMMAGKMLGADIHSAGVQISTALYWLAPMALAYLTLVLKDTANRRTNAVASAVTAVTGISLLIGQPDQLRSRRRGQARRLRAASMRSAPDSRSP